MECKDVKSMNAKASPQAQGQTLRQADIQADINGKLPTITRSVSVLVPSEVLVALRSIPIDEPVTIAALLPPSQHFHKCDLHKVLPPLKSASGPSTSPVLPCSCAHLVNILIYPEDLVYDRDPSGKVVDIRMDFESFLKRLNEEHYGQEHEMRPLLRESSDVDSELMDPTDVDAIETRIRDSKDVSTSGRIGMY